MVHTLPLELEFNIKECDDFALSLTDVYIAVHAHHTVDFGGHPALFSGEAHEVLLEVVLRPYRDILVHPVPVVRVVEHHVEGSFAVDDRSYEKTDCAVQGS